MEATYSNFVASAPSQSLKRFRSQDEDSGREIKRQRMDEGSIKIFHELAQQALATLPLAAPIDAMDIDQPKQGYPENLTQTITKLSHGILHTTNQHFISSLVSDFLKKVREQSNELQITVHSLIHKNLDRVVFSNTPWNELNHTEKNYVFNCFFSILDSNPKSSLKKNLEALLLKNASIFPLPISLEHYHCLNKHYPNKFPMVIFNHSSDHIFYIPSNLLKFFPTRQLPFCLKPLLGQTLNQYVAGVLADNSPPNHPLQAYYVSLLAKFFDNEQLFQKCLQVIGKKESVAPSYMSFSILKNQGVEAFKTLCKIAGPIVFSHEEKKSILEVASPDFWKEYIFLGGGWFNLLINRKELSSIPLFKPQLENDSTSELPFEIEKDNNSTRYPDFFFYLHFKKIPKQWTLIQRLQVLIVCDLFKCEKLKETIETKICDAIGASTSEKQLIYQIASSFARYSKKLETLLGEIFGSLLKPHLESGDLAVFKQSMPSAASIIFNEPLSLIECQNLGQHFSENITFLDVTLKDFKSKNYLLLKKFKKLEGIKLKGFSFGKGFLQGLRIPSLQSVEFNELGYTYKQGYISPLAWKNLRIGMLDSFNIPHSYGNTHSNFFEALQNLKTLNIGLRDLNQVILQNLEKLNLLQNLHIDFISHTFGVNLSDLIQSCKKLPELQSLTFSVRNVIAFNPTIFDSAPLISITNLDISAPIDLRILRLFPNVKNLNLAMKECKQEIASLLNCKDLESLSLSIPFNNQNPQHMDFSQFNKLNTIKLNFEITPESLLSLKSISTLEVVSLAKIQHLSKEILLELIKKPNLRCLEIPPLANPFALEEIFAYAQENDITLIET